MRDSVSTGRGRTLLLLALLALLFTALTGAYSDAVPAAAAKCSAVETSAATGPADRTSAPEADVWGQPEGDTRHPGNGFRRLCHATACPLRPHAPTGPSGKVVRETPVPVSAAAAGLPAPWAVLPAVDAAAPARVTVLRC
ncbi:MULTISPECIES: hypothetical protein [Streptomyces]|uniref:Secreted protein n=1 Tax=Streptomyces ramulosus TaxID=47762 RepID=A0ABW1FDH2_9ACTN